MRRERDSTYLEEELRCKRLVLKINPCFKFCNLRFKGKIKRENGEEDFVVREFKWEKDFNEERLH